jgi:ribosomal protein L34
MGDLNAQALAGRAVLAGERREESRKRLALSSRKV